MTTIIAAVAANNVIGKRGDLPWYLPEDLKRFKELTSGHPVIMGRKTYESIIARIGKPLPGRTHYVLTRNPEEYQVQSEFQDQVKLFSSFDKAVEAAQTEDPEVFIIGGEKVFADALPKADRLELTEVHKDYEGDAYFPEFDQTKWHKTEDNHGEYSYVTYTKTP
jgi:dihydrofolate reductase